MKKTILVALALALVLALPLSIAQAGGGVKADKVVILPAGEIVDRDFFAAGERVEISGTVNGDLYAAGGIVVVDGEVNGDVLAAGGQIIISGNVSEDVRVVGGDLQVSGQIEGNVTVVGGDVQLAKDADVAGSVAAAGGNISLEANVGQNVKAAAGAFAISGNIGGNVSTHVEELRVTSRAQIDGDLTYFSRHEASIDEAAVITGEVQMKAPVKQFDKPDVDFAKFFKGLFIWAKAAGLISILVLGWLLIYLYPRFSMGLAEMLRRKPLVSLGIGLLALVVTPIVIVILFATLIGWPLAFFLLFAYLIALFLAKLPVILWIGSFASKPLGKKIHPALVLLIGAVIYYLITIIPVVGQLLGFLAMIFGLGALLLTKADLVKALKEENMV